MKINRLKLPVGELKNPTKLVKRKKTTHCSPAEILGRIDEILRFPFEPIEITKAERYDMIVELLEEWKHS